MPCRTRCGSTPPTCPSGRGSSTPSWPTTPATPTRLPLAPAARPRPPPGRAAPPCPWRCDVTAGVVVVDQLRVTFGAVKALDGVDLSVPQGTTLAVLGHNGAGKTTLIRVLTTLIRPDHGR